MNPSALVTASLSFLLLLSGCGTETKDSDGSHKEVNLPSGSSAGHELLQWVDPFIGTGGKANTFPGATVPHGMVQLSPDNGRGGWDWIAGYYYPDNIIAGFSHTHLSGTGAGDLYDISFMPLTRPEYREITQEGPESGTLVSRFTHDKESASPGYYQVYLQSYDIHVELTAGPRTGLQKYRFPASADDGTVRLDLGYSRNWDDTTATQLQLLDDRTIAGYRFSTGWAKDQKVFFVSRFSRPFTQVSVFDGDQALPHRPSYSAKELNAWFEFNTRHDKEVLVQTALSSVSVEGAMHNLLAENKTFPGFDEVKQTAEQAWQRELSRVTVTASPDNLTQFYTAAYHAALAPRIYSDVDGRYRGPDGGIHQSSAHPRYEFFSLWDTFRALHPWKTITAPDRTREMMSSLMQHYRVAGRLPVWNFQGQETDMMMGYHSVPVLVDAWMKGLTDESGDAILNAALQSAMQDEFGVKSYKELGYVPHEERTWNVSLTLEYAFDDWAISQLARGLGKIDITREFASRANNYRHHFDPESGFMRARGRDGHFKTPFNADAYHPEDYCEANAWQYSFFVPQDIPGMITMMGGANRVDTKLDAMFNAQQRGEMPEWISGYIGQYVHGNEPSHHVPYLYQYLDQPHKTQKLVRRIMDELYRPSHDGLAGNEDAGQMSAWYLFSALGFYPVNPVGGEYVLGSPEVDSADIDLGNGQYFTIRTRNQSPDNVYVQSVLLNGEPLKGFILRHDQIMKGGELLFIMTGEPQ
ncbi:GH92 family glycosyl hydrolase [Shewanella submarina]|uniref:GH92 family glycosyl hydrolase n=1 Tax=Shewanella submarina TaxID=2016376 RepID=A0ABV7GBZ7_9GAMM|nr:GH92 family glycosyl hydrolase [Shewanella submarina]MCL1036816.1 GH92 family glycosyl hydrolase [Shewanella submarina]